MLQKCDRVKLRLFLALQMTYYLLSLWKWGACLAQRSVLISLLPLGILYVLAFPGMSFPFGWKRPPPSLSLIK